MAWTRLSKLSRFMGLASSVPCVYVYIYQNAPSMGTYTWTSGRRQMGYAPSWITTTWRAPLASPFKPSDRLAFSTRATRTARRRRAGATRSFGWRKKRSGTTGSLFKSCKPRSTGTNEGLGGRGPARGASTGSRASARSTGASPDRDLRGRELPRPNGLGGRRPRLRPGRPPDGRCLLRLDLARGPRRPAAVLRGVRGTADQVGR